MKSCIYRTKRTFFFFFKKGRVVMKSGVGAKAITVTYVFLCNELRENQEINADWQCFRRK